MPLPLLPSLPLPTPPPQRNGLGASCVVTPQGAWATVLDFLLERFPYVAKEIWQQRLISGQVHDGHGQAVAAEQAFQSGQRLYYFRHNPDEKPIPFEETVLYHDEHLLVADKPHFLPVTPCGKYVNETLLVRLKNKLNLPFLVPIHRIDRDTAGLVLFSTNPASRARYCALFRERKVEKTYWAIAPWRAGLVVPEQRLSRIQAAQHFMQQTEVAGTPNAQTFIRVLQTQAPYALYELRPHTGQRHQLRVHMAALGLPILGDGIYPDLTPEGTTDWSNPLQLLAKSVKFCDPLGNISREFYSKISLNSAKMLLKPDFDPLSML